MNRLRARLAECRGDHRPALVIYLTQGDPSPERSADIILAAAEAGADVIELGVPFSDPSADGPVIQAAMQRALAAGGGLASALATVRELRDRGGQVPIVLFGYYNPIFVRGTERFADDAAAAGVDAALVVDLPLDELSELAHPLAARRIDVVPLVAPTSGPDRIARLRSFAPPFVYYISMTGITGAALRDRDDTPTRVAAVRAACDAPVAVGFGIANADDARRVGDYADAVVIGSAAIRQLAAAAPGDAADAVAAFVRPIAQALRRS